MNQDPGKHLYIPSVMHQGDCYVCGNIQDHPNHQLPADGMSRLFRAERRLACAEMIDDEGRRTVEVELARAEAEAARTAEGLEGLKRDAARYRFLRDRRTRQVDIAASAVFAGRIPDNVILGGEDLDRAIDTEIGFDVPNLPTLESRLADCLADCIDTPLLQLFDPEGGSRMIEPRMSSFNRELAERAAGLLEEAGR